MKIMQDAFETIYKSQVWFNGSGEGSIATHTTAYRDFLQNFLRENDIRSVVDFGCGDWQSSRLLNLSGINYLGVDIVPSVIEVNQRQYSSKNIRFTCINEKQFNLPEADLIIVKDVLQHWPNANIQAFKDKIYPYKYSLIGNSIMRFDPTNPDDTRFMPRGINHNINPGEFRCLDLSQPPFNWPVKELFRYTVPKNLLKCQETVAIVELKH